MLRAATKLGVIAMAAVAATATSSASAQQIDDEATELTVVMTELQPFVIDDDGDADGFYAEIWDEVASEVGVDYEILWVEEFGDLLPALDDGRADVAVAPLAPTSEREAGYDFSSAVITSGPQLGFHERSIGDTSILLAVFSTEVLGILAVAIILLVLLAHAIWLVERKHPENEDFHSSYLLGVWDGLWWAVVTVTTVGYGDKAPRSSRGRVVALVGMILSLFLVGAFVSQATAVLQQRRTQPPVTGLDDLDGQPVGVVAGTSFASFVAEQGVSTSEFASQQQLFEAVADGEIDLMVANPFAIQSIGPRYGVAPTGQVFYEEFETFGLVQGSVWREPINVALADLQASGEVEAIVDRWIDS